MGKFFERGTSELTNTAGDKFDEEIAMYVWNRFINKSGSKYSADFLEKIRRSKWGTLVSIAERCKIWLSTHQTTEFLYENITLNEDIDEIITRTDLEYILEKSIDKSMFQVEEALKNAGITYNDINCVLLTGGTCHIPAVQKALIDKFGHRVELSAEPELLIAKGAAIIAEMNWFPILTKDILIQLSDESYWPIFEKKHTNCFKFWSV